MRTLTFSIVLIPLILFGCTNAGNNNTEELAQVASTPTYTCPMHPSVVSDRPGACPVCGMSLVKRSEEAELSSEDAQHISQVSLSPTQRVLANVSTADAEVGDITSTVHLVGFVDVAEPLEATVSARFRGRIEQLHVNSTGERVRAGDPMFDLYSPDLVTSVREYILALDGSARRQTQDPQLTDGIRSRLQRHYGMTTGQIAEIEASRTVRSTVTYFSPISGTVLSKEVREGEYVDEGEVLYRVADLSKVWIMLDAYEQDIRHFAPGMTVVVSTAAYPGERFSGHITFTDPIMDPVTRTTRIRAEFNNKHRKLMPNMFVSAEVEVRVPNALRIPRSALLETGRRTLVWVERTANTFEPHQVRVGFRGDASVEIISGLQDGDVVATSGGYLIDSESALQLGGPVLDASHSPETHTRADGESVINITVQGNYSPDVIRVKKGVPLRLRFFRNERSMCTKEIIFPELGIERTLADFDTTEIRITPDRVGSIHFSCGMDMVHGQLIVE